jgi:hypothetical protein
MRAVVYREDDDAYAGEPRKVEGWFDASKAECWPCDMSIDANGNRPASGVNLLRTAGGRWVLHYWSSWQGAKPTYKFINSEQAREWALANEDEGVLTRFFADLPEEIGPDLG